MRLQKYIAECGVASRRTAEKLIAAGKVKVNGEVVTAQGTKVEPTTDKISVNGKLLKRKEGKIYIKLNKPTGYVSTCAKNVNKSILRLVKDIPARLFPIGRLDKDSQGLLLMTNDGELANQLMHPRYEHEKEYQVGAKLPLEDHDIKQLKEGIMIDGKMTLPAKVYPKGQKRFSIILREGKNRQIRRMLEALGNQATFLKRVRIKNIHLGRLPVGKYEHLSRAERQNLL